ncbi:Leucine-rich repeat-containing protein 23 [Monoraphidium neglectum]|uniref:Leucine-rich repeat-containing protein 23 n=1 Tax=Monoraphidium neglectum TaxID=145388 RepID=A0A0D2JHS7_9CHLO|nr:Leucine-rich repeat-containing protein 23 [Monoraphidium neglectum]KIY98907.1 Leucine-rich repeat-containing protein 23 [Monoraphidium neglectum]|eukprot:XP_013897927.1 Leucine-rich repeat-containing protein 23 [Monoraphidium neglectum]
MVYMTQLHDHAAGGATLASMRGAPAVVISHPLAELADGGRNAKSIKDCTELCLSGRAIERLHGFEPLVNLEALWLNGNALRCATGLDANTRLRELYLHDNQLCTLRGSLGRLKFLTHLDLGGNLLRDLPKVLARLERLRCLRHLNLQGNPCCEEPGYRLQVVHRLPWLEVLDWHQVTDAERRRAREVVGGDVVSSTVAFGRRVPADNAWRERAPQQSVLEQELAQAAARVREARLEAQDRIEAEAYMRNPDAAFWMPRDTLPPPPGVAAHHAATEVRNGCGGVGTSNSGSSGGGCGGVAGLQPSGVVTVARSVFEPRWAVSSVALRV